MGLLEDLRVPSDWVLTDRDVCDLEMLLIGAFAPLKGYMKEADYHSVVQDMRLSSGEVWPMPVCLAIPKSAFRPSANSDPSGGASSRLLRLRDSTNRILARMDVEEIYTPELEMEMMKVLGTTDDNHPYVKYMLGNFLDCYYVGGKVHAVDESVLHYDFLEYRLTPKEVRSQIESQGYEAVLGFQTRNPMHRGHFELTKQALAETVNRTGKSVKLLLTPAVGPTQPGDVDYPVRVRCYRHLLLEYPANVAASVVLLPLAMRMAGPREAVWHALIRRNYGCTHFIVGRDHAGPSAMSKTGEPFYGPYEAQELLESLKEDIGIAPVFGRNMVYCGTPPDGEHVQEHLVPAGARVMNISGSELRRLMMEGENVPEWFSFPSVVAELRKVYQPLHNRGLCVYFTGLPCCGKTSIANALKARILENCSERQTVTILDADIIRTHLSKGLGFSREDRSMNVRRIGFVASEIVKHRGMCLVANIAPYEEDRIFNRKMIQATGGTYCEVYVSTPLEICESRDVKELYKKARQGVIKQFTGVSDPYEIPTSPELVIDSSNDLMGKVDVVIEYLVGRKLLVMK